MNSYRTANAITLGLRAGAALGAFFHSVASGALMPIDTAVNPANDHVYFLLQKSNWPDAENAAVAMGGHLVTINDAAENAWVWNRWGTNRSLWIGLYDPVVGDGSGAQHAANFRWTSGSTSTYRNWRSDSGEPNGDNAAYIYAKGPGYQGTWNDTPGTLTNPGGVEPDLHGVVEIEVCTPHRATATATVVNGFVVAIQVIDGGCGYTNAPAIVIEGGGGNGATAMAIVANGRVSQINVTSAGCCYTNPPKVDIASPPRVPTVNIRVSKVKVEQNVTLGSKYVLEASNDLTHWTATGPEFVAQSELIVTEMDVDVVGRFFRLRVVP